ncbi:PAS domain S-box protein [Mariprofundus sp. KV]|uniref:PAS domain S-box protein n=1 Tax=Mariprofundus sp. KV TaxID=2608715 RepID=UPI0015A2EED8|nr:PAS domain S-box protein [Mariprofundus sp. KV]NWF35671.1 PAS domain S-box protein [Mariprofundus sp. KV]
MTLTIADIITHNVITVSPETTLSAAAHLMASHKISCLVVVTDAGKPSGIITESDLVHAGSQQRDVDKTLVSEMIRHGPVTVESNQNVYEAFDFLAEHHIRHLLVVDDHGKLEGLVTFTDILRAVSYDDFLKAKPVADAMSRNVATVDAEASVLDALSLMHDRSISCVVISSGDRAVGIFTERDAARLVAERVDLAEITVSEVMTSPIKTMLGSASLLEASVTMRESGIRRMVIVDDEGKPAGILTQFDVIRGLEGDRIKRFKQLYEQAEEKLVESQKLLALKSELERIVAVSPAILYRCEWRQVEGEGTFVPTYFSPQMQDVLGYSPCTFIETPWWKEHVHPDDLPAVEECLNRVVEKGETDLTYRVRAHSGDWMLILDHARVIKDSHGVPVEMVGSWLDVTGRRQVERKLSDTEQRYSSLFNEARDMMHIVDVDGRIIDVNQMELDTLGYTREEMIGMPVMELICLEFQEETSKRIKGVFAGELHPLAETALRKKDGGCIDVEVSATPQYDADGVIIAGRAIIRDISERKQAEKALLTSRARLDFALQGADDGLWDWNLETNGVYYSPRWKAMLGYKEDELGNTLDVWAKLVDPAQKEEVLSHAQAYIDGKSSKYEVEFRMRHKDGHWVDILARARLAVDADGKPLTPPRLVGTHVDISERKAAENKLKASEEKYRKMIESSYDAIFVAETETGILIDANEQAEKMLGLPRDQIIGMHQSELHPPEEKERYKQIFIDNVQDDRAFMPDLLVRRADGTDVPVDICANVTEANGKGIVQAVFRDISERKAAENKLKASEEKYRRMVESSNDAIFVGDVETGILIDVNERAEKMLGLPREKIIGMHQGQLHPPEELERYKKVFADHAHEERSFIPDVVVRRADGKDVPVDISTNKTEINGRPVLQGVFRDITERKLAEQKVAKTAERMQRILDADFDAVVVHQHQKVVFANRAALEMFGVPSLDAAIGSDARDYASKRFRRFYEMADRRAHRFKMPIGPSEIEGLRKSDGKVFPIEVIATAMEWEGGPATVTVIRDITERREAQQQLTLALKQAESERSSLHAILNNLPFLAWLKDEQGNYLAINENFARACGMVSAESLVGKTDLDVWPQELALAYQSDDRDVMARGEPKQVEELVKVDGELRWYETFKSPVLDADGNVVGTAGIARDITERLEQDEKMRLLTSAIGSVSESIIITDAEGTIQYVNPGFTKNTGFSIGDAIGNTPAILNSKQQPKGFYQQFWQTLKDGKPWVGRILDRKKDGTIFPVHLSVAPIFNDQQEITHFVAVHEDLSEAESMQKQVMQSQKMEAVGTMVGGVAHDFNNLLASIVGNLYLMRNHHKDDARTVSRIRSMESSMQHGAQLIQQMLTFARKDRTEMQAMDLKVFMKEAHKLAHASVPENISFRLDYPRSDEMWIKGDAGQLQQVLLNLVTNAQHAVSGCEKPEIEVKLAVVRPESDSRLVTRFPEMANEEVWCCLSCSDNGRGMNAGLLDRVFEPFFTTKPVGEGTGLGLSMVYGAVQNHRGFIDLQSEPDKGTQVSIYLPLYSAEPVEIRGHDEAVVDGAGFTILLVDDEESLRQVLAEVLRHSGFSVLQAVDGEQAVEVFETQQSEIDLVLMDVVMPNKGGVTAAKEIRDIDATVPIIFQTGYGEATQLEAAASIPHSDAIQKPVVISVLMELIMRRVSR